MVTRSKSEPAPPQPAVIFRRDGRVSVKLRGKAPVDVGTWVRSKPRHFAIRRIGSDRSVHEAFNLNRLRPIALRLYGEMTW